jgi:NAD(P)-dependent dehydrogenase (short-subunit alcohol dehydrogenase family)
MLTTQLAIGAMRRHRGSRRGNLPVPPNPLHRSASRTGGFTAGSVVNVASVAGLGAGPHDAPEYAAAKAGVVRFTAALRSLAAEGIRVNAICPDYVDTPAVRRSLAHMSEDERKDVPQLVPAEAIAGDVVRLLRNDSLAGRVLVRFAEEEPYLLPERVPR